MGVHGYSRGLVGRRRLGFVLLRRLSGGGYEPRYWRAGTGLVYYSRGIFLYCEAQQKKHGACGGGLGPVRVSGEARWCCKEENHAEKPTAARLLGL